MPAKVDPEKLEAALAAMIEEMKPGLNMAGLTGTIARMQTEVNPALPRWRANEVNRATDPNHVSNAMVALIASTLVSESQAVYGPGATDEHYGYINAVLQGIAEEFGSMLHGGSGMKVSPVHMEFAGTA